jgi:hypothetical protein
MNRRLTRGDQVFVYHRESIYPAEYRYKDNFGRNTKHIVYVDMMGSEQEIDDGDLYTQPRLAREEHPKARDHTMRKGF